MKDLIGKAILDYQTHNAPEDIITETSLTEADSMSVAYLFRSYAEMPEIEQRALQMAKGKILDVGCGAGSHSLYLQEKGRDVTAIDISENSVAACKLRGLQNVSVQDIMQLTTTDQYDTILLLMNGTGLCGKLNRVAAFLQQLKSLLTPNGQILIDSSDIIYMFDEDEDGGKWIPSDMEYYGELIFHVRYKGEQEEPFDWVYIDYNTLQNAAHANGLQCELVAEGEHYDYLARLTHIKL